MSIPLQQLLSLVGSLDDSAGQGTPRERFRTFLRDSVREIGQVRDYVGECLRNKGDQYSRALQDIVNHLGTLLGFNVEFGRYQGVRGQIGFDGYWESPTGFHVVVEVKTTEVYAVRTAALVGYVDSMISEQRIPDWDHALGLYVVGRPDPELRQLENAIVAERRAHQLRITSAESLLSLAEVMTTYDVLHTDVLAVICPSGPTIDPVIELMARLVSETRALDEAPDGEQESISEEEHEPAATEAEPSYWLTPVKGDDEQTAEQVVERLVGREHVYAWGERTPGRKQLKPGDWICCYASSVGVVAHAKVVSAPQRMRHPKIRNPDSYPWVFNLDGPCLYLDEPVPIDADLRAQMDAFRGRDANGSWSWLVQGTRSLSKHDFQVVTRGWSG